MNRTEKQEQVDSLHQDFHGTQAAFLVDFEGLSVGHDTELRSRLRKAEVRYRVVKNRLAKRAIADTPMAGMEAHFRGMTAVALSQGDPAALAKLLVDFAKDHPALKIKGGVLEGGHGLDAGAVEALSKLPALPVLRATLLGVLNGPARQLATVLSEPGRQIARALDARRKQLEES